MKQQQQIHRITQKSLEMTRKDEVVFLAVALFCLCSSSSALITPNGVNFEVQALMDMKKSLSDPHGVLNWDEKSADPCGWTMIGCSQDHLVITLAIPSQSLSGMISSSIGNLTHLTSLLLQDNNISGPIPPELGKLQKLEELDLSDNLLTGEIPSSLSQLRSLQYLKLNNNSLAGVVPLSLRNLTQLTFLDLSFNNLSGPVPSLLAKTFNVSGNPMLCATGKEPQCNVNSPPRLLSSRNNSQRSYDENMNCTVTEECDRYHLICLDHLPSQFEVFCVHGQCECKSVDQCSIDMDCAPVANRTLNSSSNHAPTPLDYVPGYVLLLQLVHCLLL